MPVQGPALLSGTQRVHGDSLFLTGNCAICSALAVFDDGRANYYVNIHNDADAQLGIHANTSARAHTCLSCLRATFFEDVGGIVFTRIVPGILEENESISQPL